MNVILWVLQIVLGVYFFVTGIVHFILPPGLPEPMAWMYELSPTLHLLSGAAEILGGLGLILPGLTRIQTRLTPLAAFWPLPGYARGPRFGTWRAANTRISL